MAPAHSHHYVDTFIAGSAYGTTTVLVGQPFDTIKTRMQALQTTSMTETFKTLIKKDGFSGLYKGGLPLVVGGALIRSAQFGVNNFVLEELHERYGLNPTRILGLDPLVVCAGFCGGVSRGLVEAPFEYIKTRRQVDKPWVMREVFSGCGPTVFRNSFLFSSFMIYIDISKVLVPGGLGPFWTGAICANLAWLTIWPIDVVKSQVQSGKFPGRSALSLFLENMTSVRSLYRGLLPGLTRSFLANGCSMVVYARVLEELGERHKREKD